jgi:hypothetical protein
VQLVDEAGGQQVVPQPVSTEDQNLLARLAFELGDLLVRRRAGMCGDPVEPGAQRTPTLETAQAASPLRAVASSCGVAEFQRASHSSRPP